MDSLSSFLNVGKDFKRTVLTAGNVNARTIPKIEPNKFPKREFIGSDYGENYRKAELQDMKRMAEFKSEPFEHKSTIDDIESEAGDDNKSIGRGVVDEVYTRYKFDRILPDLPICEMKDYILDAIDDNPVIILEGATGCGKTTQVPQFILDDAYEKRKSVNIIVTQPRRIAAISIANRVTRERELPKELPHLIGYQIGLNVKTDDDTRITFCTTGVLLEKLIATRTLANYTHIILDEVHERSQNMDFLFIIIKKLRFTAPNIRIILMSATIEAAEFAEYFSSFHSDTKGQESVLTPAPVIKVDKKSNYKISEFFLNDLAKLNVNLSESAFKVDDPKIDEEMYLTAAKMIYVVDRIDCTDNLSSNIKPTILMFLPGIYEIGYMNKHIEESAIRFQRQNDFIVVILHSFVKHEDQIKALRKPTPGKRMIILATNIAESSVTVPDVKYVIDFCLTKNLVVDTTTNFTSLQLEWCSRSNCRQRAGRTGRTMDGRVYRMIPKHFYENQLEETSKPEMCRSPLETVVLKSKQLNMGSPQEVLALAMDRPALSDIQNTILLLKEVGALLLTRQGDYSEDDGDMTFIGHVMAALPVNVHVAKLIVLGHCFSVLSECIIIGAGLTTKTIFVHGLKNFVKEYSKKLVWSDGSGSDLFAILKAYKAFEDRMGATGNVKIWAGRYYLNEKSLIEMSHLIKEITERLERLGIKESTGVNRAKWDAAERSIIMKVVIAGAFYPNYFVRSSDEMGSRNTFRVINGRNPCNTVYFTGFQEKYIRPMYVESIKKILQPCTNSPDNIQVTFDEGTEKVFVSFKQTNASLQANTDNELNYVEMPPGQVCIEVYKAVKLRKTGKQPQIKVMHPMDAQKYAEKMKIGSIVKGKWGVKKKEIKNIDKICLPRKHVKNVTGKITYYDINFNRFWFRPEAEESLYNDIQKELNSLNRDIEKFSDHSDVHIDQVVAACYDGTYYRAKIVSNITGKSKIYYNVLLMDVGLEGAVEFGDLRRLRGVSAQYIDIPPRVFECRLACLQPSELHSERYGWTTTMTAFKNLTSGITLCAEIYSVENGVASVFIFVHDRTVQEILIDEKYACTADENYMSKVEHELRERAQAMKSGHLEDACNAIEDEMRLMMPFEEECEVMEPDINSRHLTVTLQGPRCPLECNIYTCLHTGRTSKNVTIEQQSVNSVFLEANPQDTFEKYVVAANVTENQNKTELVARETTTMPNIPCFGPLMALIFSPYCEFFRDKYKSRYVAILCGLGVHPIDKYPLYSEHDSYFNLDAEIDIKDIEIINVIRFCMDNLLRMRPDSKHLLATDIQQNELMINLKTYIIELLEKERPLIGKPHDTDIGWSKFVPNDVIEARDVFGKTAIFPSHCTLRLSEADSPERLQQVQSLIDNNKELHRIAKSLGNLVRPVKCMLCHLDLENLTEVKIHLYSLLHLQCEKRISLDQ